MSEIDRIEIPIDKADLVLARKDAGMSNPSVWMDGNGRIVPRNKDSNSDIDLHTVMVRKAKNDYEEGIPKRASSLKACKGLKGCDFIECSEKVFGGRLPPNLQKVKERCPI